MNVISFEKAYCLFPRATLEDRRSIVTLRYNPEPGVLQNCIEKYEERGWSFENFRDVYQQDPAFYLGDRWINDSMSWVIPLDTTELQHPPPANPYSAPLLHDPAAVCNWRISNPRSYHSITEAEVFESRNLRYTYVISNTELSKYLDHTLSIKLREEDRKRVKHLEDME